MAEIRRGGTPGVEAVIAGLPHVLFALAAMAAAIAHRLRLAPWIEGAAMSAFANAAMLSFAGVTALALAAAWMQHWPRWSASWIGYGLILPWIAPAGLSAGEGTIISRLASKVPATLEGSLLVGLILSCLGVGLLLARCDRLRGLLVALTVAPMCLCWVDSVAAHSDVSMPLLVGAGLATALAGAAMVHHGVVKVGTWLALGVNLLTRPPFTYVRLFHHDVMPPPTFPLSSASILAFVRDAAIGVILVMGPLWGWALLEQGRRVVAQIGRRRTVR
jgi:hypothetical protein